MDAAFRRKLIIAVIIALVIGATIYGFFPKAIEVNLASVTRGPLQVEIEEEGRTRLKERFVITAPTAGYTKRIWAKVGDPVKKGQTVVVLEPLRSPALDPRSRAEAQASVLSAQAALNAALEKESAAAADADYAQKRLARLTKLYAKRSIAKDEYDQVESTAKKAQATALAATAAVNVARSDLKRAKAVLQNFSATSQAAGPGEINITTPVSGTIFSIHHKSEGAVNAGEPLLDIGNGKDLEVRVEVLSADAVKIKPGMAVDFRRWGGEGTLSGIVRIVEPAGFTKISSLGVEEQRVLIIADITSPAATWRALGDAYKLEAHFIIWRGDNVLQIPTSALFRSGKDWAVFSEQNGKAVKRLVEIGHQTGLAAQIISGLREKEKVITDPTDKISDGVRIKSGK